MVDEGLQRFEHASPQAGFVRAAIYGGDQIDVGLAWHGRLEPGKRPGCTLARGKAGVVLARVLFTGEDRGDGFDVAGKLFRIGHLGSLTDVMALSGLATAEMVMADLGLPIRLGSGVAAAQDYYRGTVPALQKAA